MKKKKLSKEDIRGPDTLVKGVRALQRRLLPYVKPLLILSGVLIVIGGGYSLYKDHLDRVELEAQEVYFLVKKSLEELQKPSEEEKEFKAESLDTKKIEDFEKQITELNRIISKYPKTTARILSSFTLSDLYIEYEEKGKAVEVLEDIDSLIDRDSVLYGLLNLRLSRLKSEMGNCIEAIPALQKINANKALSSFFAESLLRQGLCYESLGQFAEAERIYKDLNQNYSDTAQGRSAKKYMRLLKQKDSL